MTAAAGRSGGRRRAWIEGGVALLVLGGVWALLFGLDPFADEQVNDRAVTRFFADAFLDGELPYRDIPFEYPPLAAPVLALTGALGTAEGAFREGIGLAMLPFAAAVVLLCGALAARTGGNRLVAIVAAALAPLLVGAVVRTHFDLVAVALTLGALLLIVSRRARLGFSALALAVLVKGFPVVVAPVALAWLWGRGERRSAVAGAVVLGLALLAGAVVAVALSPSGAHDAVRYQLERPAQVESTPAVAAYALDWLGAGTADPVASHRSNGVEHPAADALSILLGMVLVGVVALLAFLAGRAPAKGGSRPGSSPRAPPTRPAAFEDARLLCLTSLAAVAAFAALGKVLSPQFLVWTIPLLALAAAWRMYALATLLAVASTLTLVEFPSLYLDLVAREPWAVVVVSVRDLALLAAVGTALAAAIRRSGAAAARSTSPSRRLRPRPAPR